MDLAHLRYFHGYDNVDPVAEFSVDGPLFKTRFNFKRTRTVARFAAMTFEVSTATHIFGLGYSFVESREHSIGMDLRLWILATPVDGKLIDLSMVSQVREIRNPKRLFAGLGFLPTRWRAPLMNRFMSSEQRGDMLQDLVTWENTEYRSRPRLCRSDGKIMPFRYYCAQFYPDADASAA